MYCCFLIKKLFFILVLFCSVVEAKHTEKIKESFNPLKLEDFRSKAIFIEKPKPINLNSYPGASRYRTVLKKGLNEGVNFAGHLIVITNGCGSNCQMNWIVDAKNGRIINMLYSHIGTQYQRESNLLIINPQPLNDEENYCLIYPTQYFVWNGNKLEEVGDFDACRMTSP